MFGVFYAIPLMLEFEPHEENALTDLFFVNQHAKMKFYRQKLSSLGQNSVFRWTYVLINALGVYIIPLTIIAILNRKLLLSIRLLERRSAEYNAPLPTKQGLEKKRMNEICQTEILRETTSGWISIVQIESGKFSRSIPEIFFLLD